MRSVFESLPGDGYLVLVPGMFHQNPSDFPYFVRSPLDQWMGLDGPIDAQRAHAIVNAYSFAFFDRHLKGAREPLLDGPAAQFPDLRPGCADAGMAAFHPRPPLARSTWS
jgi:platelet-activating factor acetylhydrolase isoform II